MTQQVDSDQYAQLEAAVSEHQARLESGHSDIMEVVEQIRTSLSTLADKAGEEIRYAEELRDQTRAQLDTFRGSASDDENAVNELSSRLESLESHLQSRDDEIVTLRARCEELESSSDSEELESLRAKYQKAKEHIERVETGLKEQGEAIEAGQAAKRKVAELETTIAEYSEAAKADQERNAKLQQRIEELSASEQFARAEVDKIQQDLAENQSVSHASKQVADTAQVELNSKREELEALRDDCFKLKDQLEESNRDDLDSKAKLKSVDEELSIARADVEKATARASELEASEAKISEEFESLRSRARATVESEQSKTEALKKAEAELGQLRKDVVTKSSLEERVSELEEELSVERSGATKTVLAGELTQALKERDDARAELKKSRNQLAAAASSTVSRPAGGSAAAPDERATIATEPEPDIVITAESPDHLFGEILFQSNLITQAQLDDALALQESEYPNEHVGAILVTMGVVSEDTVAQALAFQHGIEFTRLHDSAVSEKTKALVTRRLAEKHHCVPLRVESGSLVLAMDNPLDLIAIEDVERSSELPVRAVMATRSDLAAAIALHYGSVAD